MQDSEKNNTGIEDEAYYRAYFGKDADEYISLMVRKKMGGGSKFNIFSFLFALFWFVYRKMYIIAIGLFIFSRVLEKYMMNQSPEVLKYSAVISLGIGVFFGFFGNDIYFWNAKKTIERAKSAYSNEEEIIAYLKKTGGVSLLSLAIALVLVIGSILIQMRAIQM